jgi:hypothetical protein
MKKVVEAFKDILNRVTNEKKVVLGRWSISYNNNSINKKIDSGNEDHCGTCGQYNLKKIKDIHFVNKK